MPPRGERLCPDAKNIAPASETQRSRDVRRRAPEVSVREIEPRNGRLTQRRRGTERTSTAFSRFLSASLRATAVAFSLAGTALADAGGLPAQGAQVVQLGAAH